MMNDPPFCRVKELASAFDVLMAEECRDTFRAAITDDRQIPWHSPGNSTSDLRRGRV